MKKYLICMILCLLAISLCACISTGEADLPETDSLPDIESIVEPVAEAVSSAESALESEPEHPASVLEDVADLVPAPVASAAGGSEASAAIQPPDAVSPPDSTSQPEALPELWEALAPDIRLDSGRIEKELLRLINAMRDGKGVHTLGVEDALLAASRIRAAEAFESFSHTRPDGTPYNTAFDEAGFSYTGKWHGENLSSLRLAGGSMPEEEIALKMFNGLKSSPGHYRNMTEGHFVQVGIGVAVTYTDEGVDVTSAQMFAGL